VHTCSIHDNWIEPTTGEKTIAEAIAANEESALSVLWGFRLALYLDDLGLTNEHRNKKNHEILAYLHERRVAGRVKSARGGAR
jgi:hypothetical protein